MKNYFSTYNKTFILFLEIYTWSGRKATTTELASTYHFRQSTANVDYKSTFRTTIYPTRFNSMVITLSINNSVGKTSKKHDLHAIKSSIKENKISKFQVNQEKRFQTLNEERANLLKHSVSYLIHSRNILLKNRPSRELARKTDTQFPHPLDIQFPHSLPLSGATNTTVIPSKSTTPSIESLMPSKIIPSLPPHLRLLTTTTPLPVIFFNNSYISNVTAQLGQSVFLPCRTRHSSDRKVSAVSYALFT